MYLQVKQLNKSYGSRQVVSNVDFQMEEGEILSLLGPSGCGKTTILRSIAGLVTPDSGVIQVGDRVLFDGKRGIPVEERQIGMVFQDYALWPHMTVGRNIAFGMRLRHFPSRMIAERIQDLLKLVNLPGMSDRYPYQLSGGQQQRVALARALATEPRVLLLDEPLSSLDAALRETMRTELVQIFRRLKITTINVTHDQDEAMSMSDRIMVLRDGQVQQVGSPTELYLNPANLFVASFMGAANLLPGQIKQATSQAASEYISLHLISSSSEQQVFTGLASHEIRQQLNGHASILCRPDDVLIHRAAVQFKHSNILPGTVSHVSFVGGRWHTQVRLAEVESQSLLIYAPFQPEVHQQVWLELPPDRCRIVPR
jgi:ABC-type Fe3+/spermidine/putrescine transport system ATPase subunit